MLIAAHGNSLRALVMQFEKLTPEQILEVNIPTGVPCAYTFDKDWNVVDKHYIGDLATIEAKINAVANQARPSSPPLNARKGPGFPTRSALRGTSLRTGALCVEVSVSTPEITRRLP